MDFFLYNRYKYLPLWQRGPKGSPTPLPTNILPSSGKRKSFITYINKISKLSNVYAL